MPEYVDLSVTSSSTGCAEDRVRKVARGRKRLELVAEVGAEQVVDDREHLRPGPIVHRQRQHALSGLRAPLAEDLHVCVTEAVDRLELVADEEELVTGRPAGEQVDQLALEPVRVLELVDHDRPEAQLLALADRLVVAQEIARAQLQILEVERGLAVLALLIRSGKAVEQFLQQIAVGRGELVERRLLHELARLFVRGGALTAQAEVAKIEDPVGAGVGVEIRDGLPGRLALRVAGSFVVGEAAGGFAKLVDATAETRALPQLEDELAARRPERLVDAGEHPPQPVGPVDGEQPQPRGIVRGAESRQRLREGLAAEHAALAVVEHAEAWVDARGERMRAQQPVAEAVDRGDPRPVELAREVGTSTLDESARGSGCAARRPLSRCR